jgi:hypothetical protein
MPKNSKKVKQQGVKAVQTDDDFDDMLAEMCAADVAAPKAPRIGTLTMGSAVHESAPATARSSSSSNSSSTSSSARAQRIPPPIPAGINVLPAMDGMSAMDMAIMTACVRCDTTQLRLWGRQGVRIVNAKFLCASASKGASLDVLRCLVKGLGADANLASEQGGTPLSYAAQVGRLAAVQCLVTELGADVNKAHKHDGSTPVMMAAEYDRLDVLEFLLKANADVNRADTEGFSPLFWAAKLGSLSVVRCLLKYGANINQADNAGITPLMVASFGKHAEVVTWLIKAGADPQIATAEFADGSRGTAADISRRFGASAEQTAYLEAKTHCSNTDCSGAGLKRCPACKQARYCGEPCQLAHWKAHKADCQRWSAELKADY